MTEGTAKAVSSDSASGAAASRRRLRVHNFTISLDGLAAGPRQSLGAPMGEGGLRLHEWMHKTRSYREAHGATGGEEGFNSDQFALRCQGVGATIMGRNMFGPVRGPWLDGSWRGWWGEVAPFPPHVFVLTHHKRAPVLTGNGVTFHFVDGTPVSVLAQAFSAAAGSDVELGGGVSTLRQFLAEGLVDDLHLVVAPVILREGEQLFGNGLTIPEGYESSVYATSDGVAHARITRNTH